MSRRTKYRVRIISSPNPRYASADEAMKAAVPALAALILFVQVHAQSKQKGRAA